MLAVDTDCAHPNVRYREEAVERSSSALPARGLASNEDVEILTESVPAGSAAAVLGFEHTWFKPLRNALVNAGGRRLTTPLP